MRMNAGSVRVVNPYVHLDVTIDGVSAGRLIFELRADVLPKTCENFRLLCRGQSFQGNNRNKRCFQGCKFNLIMPGQFLQSGDVIDDCGACGESVFGTLVCALNMFSTLELSLYLLAEYALMVAVLT